ncbi:LADA_0C03400g1_1 [Lachancea dasiensis]|uniref:LADA_0C03400g1_1 n=1 Tax=Lachancea dasiensis TaxID=1072105 RepID=A0A1G4IYA9_9SACH|nr:LADA_0C03400g1_1 [Lachancea dasiensis]
MSCEECPICYDPLDAAGCRLLDCDHKYHLKCIRRWHHQSQDLKCPTCRKPSQLLEIMESQAIVDLKKFSGVNWLLSEIAEPVINLPGVVEESNRSWSSRSLECGICGDMGPEINAACTGCGMVYHDRCLRVLQLEVGNMGSNLFCCNCHSPLRSSEEPIPSASAGINATGSSIAAAVARVSPGYEAVNRDTVWYEVNESWRLLSQLQQESRQLAESNHKRKIQNHVRRVLHLQSREAPLGSQLTSKDRFTDVNKIVSRQLYRLSGNIYRPETIDYDQEAAALVLNELANFEETSDVH